MNKIDAFKINETLHVEFISPFKDVCAICEIFKTPNWTQALNIMFEGFISETPFYHS